MQSTTRPSRDTTRASGKEVEQALRDIERDRWPSAEEALDYGLASRIVERAAELDRPDGAG